MAILIKTDGTTKAVTPKDPKHGFSAEEVHALIGCDHFEMAPTNIPSFALLVDDNGKLLGKGYNLSATLLYKYGYSDCIVGDALLVNLKNGELQ